MFTFEDHTVVPRDGEWDGENVNGVTQLTTVSTVSVSWLDVFATLPISLIYSDINIPSAATQLAERLQVLEIFSQCA